MQLSPVGHATLTAVLTGQDIEEAGKKYQDGDDIGMLRDVSDFSSAEVLSPAAEHVQILLCASEQVQILLCLSCLAPHHSSARVRWDASRVSICGLGPCVIAMCMRGWATMG